MTWPRYLVEASLVPSVGHVGDSYVNALAEANQGHYKSAVIWRRRSWPCASAVKRATLRWTDWCNYQRLFGPIGHMPPAKAEANDCPAIDAHDMLA